jgi:hypothetical protein
MATLDVVIVAGLFSVHTIDWDGRLELTLKLVSETGRQAKTLLYATENKREIAEWIAQNPKADMEAGFRLAERRNDEFMAYIGLTFLGRPFKLMAAPLG